MDRRKKCRQESNWGCRGRGIICEFVFKIFLNVSLLLQFKKKSLKSRLEVEFGWNKLTLLV